MLSETLGLDYKTVTHHLRILKKFGLILSPNAMTYGMIYELAPFFNSDHMFFEAKWSNICPKGLRSMTRI